MPMTFQDLQLERIPPTDLFLRRWWLGTKFHHLSPMFPDEGTIVLSLLGHLPP